MDFRDKTFYPIVYKCDPAKNKLCKKTECQKRCFYTIIPDFAANSERLRFDAITGKVESLESR